MYALNWFRGYECQMYILYIFVLKFFIGFQLNKECLTCTMAITFSVILGVRNPLMLLLCSVL